VAGGCSIVLMAPVTAAEGSLGPDGGDQRLDADDVHDAGKIVGQHVADTGCANASLGTL
jgi:hypothetical protein